MLAMSVSDHSRQAEADIPEGRPLAPLVSNRSVAGKGHTIQKDSPIFGPSYCHGLEVPELAELWRVQL